MDQLQWQCCQFQELENYQVYELIKLRVDIFVVEQHCPYPELDNKDTHQETRHICVYRDSKLVAYARLLPAGLNYSEVSIGRFAVEITERRKGIGSNLMRYCLSEIERLWPDNEIRVGAQTYLKEFYEKFGFIKVSDEYLEDNIPHVEMLRQCQN